MQVLVMQMASGVTRTLQMQEAEVPLFVAAMHDRGVWRVNDHGYVTTYFLSHVESFQYRVHS